ncbi:hypothetical protein ABEO75_09540 [Paenibacillus macerans]|uniref:hypothetical protein n=1 Tax=Paenibacillus macerans TaxID=44252 RepID=UPI002E24DF35|nr:hypothetical protein [Paenibacillus macerans]
MRTLGKFAIYNGKEYTFLPRSGGSFALISFDSIDLNNGFKKIGDINEKRYIKDVHLEELSFVYQKDTEVTYKGDIFIGSIIEDNKIMLYTRDVPLGKKHNMIMRDKDEYYLYVDLKDIDEITQKWKPCPQYIKTV